MGDKISANSDGMDVRGAFLQTHAGEKHPAATSMITRAVRPADTPGGPARRIAHKSTHVVSLTAARYTQPSRGALFFLILPIG